ncbi:MAG: MBL fold metallo-hydrolase [Dysgonamonadaceae bacterium]|jgi:glyoxylase-like metal-dependent hydrolase (beta-lactamase superfamily II)|nr:MBL fold metallo-hydrolase [Dysgonamonadaceae bacterium]
MIHYRILETGFFLADGGAMFGAVPKRAWKRAYKADDDNNCRLAMNCLLVWNDKRVVLLDTGVGLKSLGKLSCYRFNNLKDIAEPVYSCGFEPGQVTDVVLSHLHFDHCGGCTYMSDNRLNITFPKARHWVSKLQWETYMNPNELERHSYRSQDMTPVFDAGLVRLIDKDVELFEGFNLSVFNGHTKGQIVSFIDLGKTETLLFPGDVIPTKAHLSDSWISAYDIEPLESLAAKKRIKERTDGKHVTHVFYHDAYQTE